MFRYLFYYLNKATTTKAENKTKRKNVRDCAIIIRRGAEKLEGGALHKIAARIGGAQSKITHLTEGGP